MSTIEMWLSSLLLVVVLPVLAVGGAFLVRRVVGPEVLVHHNDVAGFIYSVIGVVYAVLLGFTAIIVWGQYRSAQEGVEREANALADLYRDAEVFPPEVRDQLEGRLRNYGRLVVEKEWPAMAVGKSSSETWETYNQLWRTYHEFKPQDDHQRAWYAESLQRLNVLADQRRNRLLSIRSGLPGIIWAVLFGGAAITIAFSFFFGLQNARAQGLMVAGLTLTIGIVLLSIIALEHPFAGISPVDPGAFQQVEKIFDVWSQAGAGRNR
jgi:hypothetical protein